MGYHHLEVGRDQEGAWVRVTLNRPEVRNAFHAELIQELTDCFLALGQKEGLRAIVLAGAGKVFCAGADANWMRTSIDLTPEENRRDARAMAEMLSTIDECPVPVIARVQGAALGGGVGLIAACDIVVAAEDAQFALSEVRLGIVPAVISSFALRKIGISHARRYFLTAERFPARRAYEMGLVHELVPSEKLDAVVEKILGEILMNGPQAVREAKALIRRVPTMSPGEVLEHCAETTARVRTSEEGQEGLRAFLEKRTPRWVPEHWEG